MNKPDEPMDLDEASNMLDEALAAIDAEDFEKARSIGRELGAVKYSGVFEIRARLAEVEDDFEAALRHLAEGLSKAPEAWSMWELQGIYQSTLQRFDEAEASFERALACPTALHASVVIHQAVLATRRNQPGLALEILDRITEQEMDDEFMDGLVVSYLSCEMCARRMLRDDRLSEGSVFEVLVDLPCPPGEDDSEETVRIIQLMHIAAASEEDVLPLLVEDFGEEFEDTVIDEISVHEDGAGLLTGIYWISPTWQPYDVDAEEE